MNDTLAQRQQQLMQHLLHGDGAVPLDDEDLKNAMVIIHPR